MEEALTHVFVSPTTTITAIVSTTNATLIEATTAVSVKPAELASLEYFFRGSAA